MATSYTEFLRRLGAPLKIARQSWGSVRKSDEAVFLTVWQDKTERVGDCLCGQLTFDSNTTSAGAKERLRHIAMIQNGATCFLISAIPKDKHAHPRTVKDCRDDAVFVGGEIIDHKGALWIKLGRLVPIAEVLPTHPAEA
jgi:hypothetical protein